MKFIKNRMRLYLILFLAGILLAAGSYLLSDHEASGLAGMGVGMSVISGLKCIQMWRISRDPEKIRKFEYMQHEERHQFIAQKSGSWAFYLTMIGLLVSSLLVRIWGTEAVANALGYAGIASLGLYWLIWFINSRRY